MHAHPGDVIRVRGPRTGVPDRVGQVISTRGADGGPPFVVRWDDRDHDVLFFPDADTVIEAVSADRAAAATRS